MSLKTARTRAFHAQHGRCFYCEAAMWRIHPSEVGLVGHRARLFQLTAEHLLARRDGGTDDASNIVAACLLCNGRRHARRTPLSPADFRRLVRHRLAQGKWKP